MVKLFGFILKIYRKFYSHRCCGWRPACMVAPSRVLSTLGPPPASLNCLRRRTNDIFVCSIQQPVHTASYLSASFCSSEDISFSLGALWDRNRRQTELFVGPLLGADKAEEGTWAWQLHRIGLKQRNSQFSGKLIEVSFLGCTRSVR